MQKMLEHYTRICHLKQTQELLKKYLITKTEEELLVQDKKIEKYIMCENLSSNEQADVNIVITTERDMESFFQGFPSVDALPADFALGFYSVTLFF